MTNVITPTSLDEDSDESFTNEKEMKNRPYFVDCICSIRFMNISIVLFLCIIIVGVCAVYTTTFAISIVGLSNTLRSKSLSQVKSEVTQRTLPVKLYGQLILSDFTSGMISYNVGMLLTSSDLFV
jgi:hypothetical protein